MSKNLIPEIAKMLGVGIDEEFKVTGSNLTYRFTEKNLEAFYKDDFGEDCFWGHCSEFALADLIKGKNEVIKLPWCPRHGDEYWTYSGGIFVPVWDTWKGSATDYVRLKCGCVFRTKGEALDAVAKIYKELTGNNWQDNVQKDADCSR